MKKIYGPNTTQVQAYLDLLPTLTNEQWDLAQDAEWDTEWYAARAAARAATRAGAWDAAWYRTQSAAGDAAWAAQRAALRAAGALVVRDLIPTENFDILTAPMHAAGVNFDKLEG